MEQVGIKQPFTELQLEFLKLFAQKTSKEDLLAIKILISKYFAEKTMDAVDSFWSEKEMTVDQINNIAHEHNRTNTDKKPKTILQ